MRVVFFLVCLISDIAALIGYEYKICTELGDDVACMSDLDSCYDDATQNHTDIHFSESRKSSRNMNAIKYYLDSGLFGLNKETKYSGYLYFQDYEHGRSRKFRVLDKMDAYDLLMLSDIRGQYNNISSTEQKVDSDTLSSCSTASIGYNLAEYSSSDSGGCSYQPITNSDLYFESNDIEQDDFMKTGYITCDSLEEDLQYSKDINLIFNDYLPRNSTDNYLKRKSISKSISLYDIDLNKKPTSIIYRQIACHIPKVESASIHLFKAEKLLQDIDLKDEHCDNLSKNQIDTFKVEMTQQLSMDILHASNSFCVLGRVKSLNKQVNRSLFPLDMPFIITSSSLGYMFSTFVLFHRRRYGII